MHTERQQEIIEAAIGLIQTKGIQGLTIKNLAAQIGISEPAIYRHFENKIQILITILDVFSKNSASIFQENITNTLTSVEKTGQLFRNHFMIFAARPSLTSVVFSEEIFRNEPLLTEKISQVIESNRQALVSILSEGQANQEIRSDIEAENLAIIIMGSLRLFVKRWQFSDFSFNLITEGEQLIQDIQKIISKD
jgi:AcrR family transcriptional regulator